MRTRFLVAAAVSLVVVGSSPYVGQLRNEIQQAFPDSYRTIILGIVGTGLGLAAVTAAVRIRDRRRMRYGVIAAAAIVGVTYALATATGFPDVDAVERFHFVEYGFIALLFYRVWRPNADATTFVLPLCAGIIVGTLDEGVQWFVPGRVGEMHDVLLNAVAIGCGLAFGFGLEPPARLAVVRDPRSRAALAAGLTLTVAIASVFFDTVHIGHEIRDPVSGRFLSTFAPDRLAAGAAEHATALDDVERLVRPPRLSREDQWLAEALWHVSQRNRAAAAGDHWTAWRENLILERHFAPVLTSRYGMVIGAPWPADQRANVAAAVAGDERPYVSEANPYPIYTWRPGVFRAAVTAAIAVLWWLCFRLPASVSTSSIARSIT